MKTLKLKYFMRGLGCGIIFAVVLLFLTTKGPSDKEIMEKAEKLGMVLAANEEEPEDKLADLNKESEQPSDVEVADTKETEEEPTVKEEPEVKEEPTVKEEPAVKEEPVVKEEPAIKEEPVVKEEPVIKEEPVVKEKPIVSEEKPVEETEVTFQISKGMYSYAVSLVLEEKGIIESAKDFDRYLIRNGYQDDIQSGSYSIKEGTSYESIARQITK